MTRDCRRSPLRFVASLLLALAFARPAFAEEPYRLGYGDAVSVTIVNQPAMAVNAEPIRPDGRLSLPLIPEVRAEGRTVAELTATLEQAYVPYFQHPQVLVHVDRFRPLRVTLIGKVAHPGTFDFDRAPTLVEALAMAGGLTDRGERKQIRVIAPGQAPVSYDLDTLLADRRTPPQLAAGTVVEVPEVWGPDLTTVLPIAATLVTAAALVLQLYYH